MPVAQPPPFGQWLKRLRAERDLTQDQLAELLGCAVFTVRTYEMGTRRPSRAMAERMAELLELPTATRDAFLRLARAPLGPGGTPSAPDDGPVVAELRVGGEPARRAQLPAASNPLLGRTTELAELGARLRDPDCRLLTLLGPGGVGKTRLALQLAANLVRDAVFPEVIWVELVSLTDAAQLPAVIAAALGAPAVGALPSETQLLDALRDRQALLVLDNFEQLRAGAPLLTAILRAAPGMRLLVTSRERVRAHGEWVYTLDGLATSSAVGLAGAYPTATLLFLERARQVDHSFALTAENQGAVDRICRLLAGMPLAIELAAVWVRALSCAEIADELDRSLDLLVSPEAADAPHHRSLRAVFERSWGLLGRAQQDALARLSVFRGGWDRTAALAVAGADPPALAALIDASLVRRLPAAQGARYTLHELVRQYAAERLRASPDDEAATAERHAAHFAAQLQAHVAALQSDAQPVALARLRPDLDNIWSAWLWATRQRAAALLRAMARGLMTLCEDLGRLQEAAHLFEQAVAALETAPREVATAGVRGELLTRYGYFLGRCGQLAAGELRLREALALLPAGEQATRGQALAQLALLGYQQGAFAQAVAWADEAAAELALAGDTFYLGLAACFAGLAATAQGQLPEAAARLEASVALWRRNGYPRGIGLALIGQSELALATGAVEEALAQAGEAVRLCAGQYDRWGLALALAALGTAALASGDATEAYYLCAEAAESTRALGENWGLCRALLGMAWSLAATGAPAQAADVFGEVMRIARESGLLPAALHASHGLAALAPEDEARQAALVVVCRHPATEHHVRQRASALWAQVAARIDETRAAQLWDAAAGLYA